MHLPHADVELLFQFKDAGTAVKIASWNVNSVRARLQNILECCGNDLKCFLQIGSSDEYGNCKSPLSEGIR